MTPAVEVNFSNLSHLTVCQNLIERPFPWTHQTPSIPKVLPQQSQRLQPAWPIRTCWLRLESNKLTKLNRAPPSALQPLSHGVSTTGFEEYSHVRKGCLCGCNSSRPEGMDHGPYRLNAPLLPRSQVRFFGGGRWISLWHIPLPDISNKPWHYYVCPSPSSDLTPDQVMISWQLSYSLLPRGEWRTSQTSDQVVINYIALKMPK